MADRADRILGIQDGFLSEKLSVKDSIPEG